MDTHIKPAYTKEDQDLAWYGSVFFNIYSAFQTF